jgi:hypothetical protein
MTQTSPNPIRLSHHAVELDDGRRIGLSVGGRGVPLLFMHGLLLSRKAYLRMLSRIAGMGFLVVAATRAASAIAPIRCCARWTPWASGKRCSSAIRWVVE